MDFFTDQRSNFSAREKSPVEWDPFYTMAGGLVGALLAAVPGVIDMFSIADPKPGELAWNHMIVNIVTTAAFGLNLYLRTVLEPGAFFQSSSRWPVFYC